MLGRIAQNRVHGAGPAAFLLRPLAPVLLRAGPLAQGPARLASPACMARRRGEPDAGRCRRHVVALPGSGRAGLRAGDVAAIFLGGVLLTLALVLRIAPDAGTGWAAVPGWLLLVNGLALAVPALVLRRRIPGLPAALLFFVPLGSALVPTAGASAQQHLVGLAAALTLHAALAARMRRPERAPA